MSDMAESERNANSGISHEMLALRVNTLISEHNQIYTQLRHNGSLIASLENLFTTISFAILAYTVGQDLGKIDLYMASLVSISLYVFVILDVEKKVIVVLTQFDRIREIEKTIQLLLDDKDLYRIDIRRQAFDTAVSFERIYDYFSPSNWLSYISLKLGIRQIRFCLLLLLVLIWAVRIWK